jgi:phenylalanyl-tRNA synthetase beta chain
MKWTYDWLKDYLDTNATAAEIADALTRIGLEVEELIEPAVPITAKIIECEKHPDSDHLHVLRVDDGSGTLRTVVCGAPNVRVGLVSALALPGCRVGDMEIKSGKIRGILSDGMMCSAKELGISDDHSGIIELDEEKETLGKQVSTINHKPLTIFDAGITPNRPDYLAVRGIALDLCAAGMGKFIHKYDNYNGEFQDGARKAVIENYNACPVYYLCEIRNIKMAPSNPTIAGRLGAIGINPKNAPIDATNYICYDLGQPMHCFDADEIQGDIVIRNARAGEKFTDLFGGEHELADTDLVITDSDGILALAGVIGGLRGMTTDKTKNILLESAYFDPVVVRKTSKRIGISTDASYRYERGIDPTIASQGIAQAAKIITSACGGNVETSYRDWDKKNPKLVFMSENPENTGAAEWLKILEPRRISYSPDLFLKKTGIDLAADQQKQILESLGFGVEIQGKQWTIIPTPARVDVVIPENIVSELIRLYGYDKIKSAGAASCGCPVGVKVPNIDVKRMLAARGLSERISFGFGNSAAEKALSDKPSVILANPITAELDTARNGLLGNMLDAVADNEKRGYPDLNLFELDTVFDGDMPGRQHAQLVVVRTGAASPKHWQKRDRPVDVFDVKADLIALLRGQEFDVDTENPPKWAHPFRYGAIMLGGEKIAEFAELHPAMAKLWKIKTNVCVGLVDNVVALPAAGESKRAPIVDFQPIRRDFAFVVDSSFPAGRIADAAIGADARITGAVIFDAFDLPDGQKSVAFTITIQPTENMSDADLLAIQNAVIERVEKSCPAKLRA